MTKDFLSPLSRRLATRLGFAPPAGVPAIPTRAATPAEVDEFIARVAMDRQIDERRITELENALRAIIRITDGSQPIDYPGALMVARSALGALRA